MTTDVGGSGWPSAPADAAGGSSPAPGGGAGEETERALLAAMEAVRSTIADEVVGLDTELGEIDMLASQATAEADRHEERRARAEERVTALERDPGADPKDLKEARSQLLTQIRRAALFEAQQQLLEGKQRTLQRFRDRMSRADEDLRSVRASAVRGVAGSGSYAAALAVRPGGGDTTDPSVLLRAQEELRREIARQMHDGPAQSLANIALQAEIVLRLASRGDPRTQGELDQLRVMVEQALAATKEFIFDVRPMVLDDLGLVPTLRRTALDRGARAGVVIDLDSVGTERRLPQDTESGVFRLIDDTINGYLSMRPSRLAVRLDWGERRLGVMVRAAWLAEPRAPVAAPSSTRLPDDLPPALRQMIEQTRDQERQTVEGVHALPPDLLTDLGDRARVMGVGLEVSSDGTTVELSVHTS